MPTRAPENQLVKQLGTRGGILGSRTKALSKNTARCQPTAARRWQRNLHTGLVESRYLDHWAKPQQTWARKRQSPWTPNARSGPGWAWNFLLEVRRKKSLRPRGTSSGGEAILAEGRPRAKASQVLHQVWWHPTAVFDCNAMSAPRCQPCACVIIWQHLMKNGPPAFF